MKFFDSPAPSSATFLSEIDARWRLLALLLATAALTLLTTPAIAVLALLLSTGLAALIRVPCRWLCTRLGAIALVLAPFLLVLPFIVSSRSDGTALQGLWLALTLGCKALAMSTLLLVLIAAAPLPVHLQAAHAMHVPGRLVQLALLAYRYLFMFTAELARLRTALRVRGYRSRATRHSYRTVGHVTGILMVRGYERAERVGQAMQCRGFDGRFRTLVPMHTRWADVLFSASVVLAVSGLVAWDVLRR